MSNSLQVVACPNPFKVEKIDYTVEVGKSILEIMAAVQPDPILRKYAHVYINDEYVPQQEWATTFPGAKSLVTIRVVPHGGGGDKNPLATILMIAVIVVATIYGGPLGAKLSTELALGLSAGQAAALGTALIGITGSLLVNAIAPPPSPKLDMLSTTAADSSPTYSLEGARNRARAYQSIPRLYGRHKIVPDYGANPYTELVGQDQYLRMLFIVGYGPLSMSDFKIGETDLFDYDDVEIETRAGYDDDTPLALFPSTVTEDAVSTTLTYAGGWTDRTTEAEIDEFSVEVLFPQGLVQFDSVGNATPLQVSFDIEYKLTTDSTYTQVFPVVSKSAQSISVAPPPGFEYRRAELINTYYRTDLIYINALTGRVSVRTSAVAKGTIPATPATPDGAYPIASYYVTGDTYAVQGVTDLRPAVLKQYSSSDFEATAGTFPTVTVAAGQYLSEYLTVEAASTSPVRYGITVPVPINGQYDVRVRRATADRTATRDFDTSVWSIMRSIENADPVALSGLAKVALRIKATDQLNGIIDEFSLVAGSIINDWDGSTWDDRVSSNPAAIYRDILQGNAMKEPLADSRIDVSALQIWAEECASNGFMYNGVIDQKDTVFSLLKDVCAIGRAAYACKDGLHSIVRDSPDIIDAGPTQWLTPRNSWDVSGSKAFDSVHAVQVTFVNEDLDWRQDTVTVYRSGYDEETATRIDEMELPGITSYQQAWTMARYYLAVATLRPEMHSRFVDAEHLVCTRGDMIRVTDDIAMHGLYTGRIKSLTTDGSGNVTALVIDETVTMELGQTYAARVRYAEGGDYYFSVATVAGESTSLTPSTAIPAANAPEVGDLLMFGYTEQETADKIIHHIEMSSDLTAQVFYVDAADVWTSGDTDAPEYDPGISVPSDIRKTAPTAPVIQGVVSDERALVLQQDGSLISRIIASVVAATGDSLTDKVEVRWKKTGTSEEWHYLAPARPGAQIISGVVDGVEYDIEARSISYFGAPSTWTSTTETVIGRSFPPPTPTTFLVTAQPDGTRQFDFSLSSPPLDLAGFKIRYRLGTGWTWDDMTALHEGVLSASPLEINQLAAGEYMFACKSIDTTGNLSDDALYITTTLPDPRLEGAIAVARESSAWSGTLTDCFVNELNQVSANDTTTWGDLTTWSGWTAWNDSPESPIYYEREFDLGVVTTITPLVSVDADGTVVIEESHSDDDVTYSSYATTGSPISCRYIKIRVEVSGSWPLIREITTILSAKPIIDELEDIDTSALTGAFRIGTGDIRLPITEDFATIRTVFVTLQNVGAGYSWELIDKDTTTGPRIKIYNSSGVAADATIDATVRGL